MKKIVLALMFCAVLAACDSPEEKAQAHYESGLALLDEGDAARARLEFRNALQDMNTHLEARIALARLNMREGITRQALNEYVRVVEQQPDNLEALIAVSQLAFGRQAWDAFERYSTSAIETAPADPAVQIIEKAVRYRTAVLDEDTEARRNVVRESEVTYADNPDSSILRSILLDGYLRDQNFTKALIEVDKLIAVEPKNIDHYNLKLRLLSGIQDLDSIEAELRKMVGLFPENLEVRGNFIRYLIQREKTLEAEEFLRSLVATAEDDETRDSQRTTLVQFILQARGVDAALEELSRILEEDPSSAVAVTLKASLDFDAGRRDEGMQALQAFLESSSETASQEQLMQAKVTLANMLLVVGNEVGARREVEEILQSDASNVAALKMQARWMIQDDATDDAITTLRTALGESPQDVEAMLLMAAAYERAGNTPLRLDFLSLAVEASNNAPAVTLRYAEALGQNDQLTQAESTLISALRLQRDNIDILSALAQIYTAMEDMDRLRDVVRSLENLDTPPATNLAANLRLQLLEIEDGPEEALSYLEGLASQEGRDDSVRLALIRGHLLNGDNAQALALAEELLRENPDNITYRFFKALTNVATQNIPEAVEELNALVTENPQATQIWLQLIRLQERIGDQDSAKTTLDRALTVNPQDPNLLWAKASQLERDNDVEGAIEVYENLYQADSSSIVVANNLASLLATYRRDEESLARAALVARRLQGTDIPALQDTYGWIQHRTGNSEEALDYLESAAAALTEDPTVQYHLAVVYQALGRTVEAIEQILQSIDKLSPLTTTDLAEEIRTTHAAWQTTEAD